MYHINKLNQVLFRKNLSPTSLASKDLQTECDDSYISALTRYQKKVACFILPFRNKPRIILKNETIALAIGCSTKTVTRATNKFLKDGFITKHQQNKYAPNNYAIKNVKISFSHWFQSLSLSNQNLYDSHGIRIDHNNKIIYSYRNVPQTKSSLIFSSLSSLNPVVSSRGGAVRNVQVHGKKNPKKGRKMNSVQKQLILDNRNDPRVKDMLKDPKLMAHIITPVIKKITQLLTLDEKEQFKLTAFTDETLDYVYSGIKSALSMSKAPRIDNRMGWLVSLANKYCKSRGIEPDWQWYYDLCEITGMDSKTEQKPLVITLPQQRKGGIYKPWRAPKEEPVEDQIKNLKKDIQVLSTQIESKQTASYMIAYAMNVIEGKYKQLQMLEAEQSQKKESEHEKQNVSNRYSSDSMATCNA
jgi:hypothetical protein